MHHVVLSFPVLLGIFSACQALNDISYFHLGQLYQNVIKLNSTKTIEFVYRTTAVQSVHLAISGFPIPIPNRTVTSSGTESTLPVTLNSLDLFSTGSKHGAYSVNATLFADDTHYLAVPMIVIYEETIKDVQVVVVPQHVVFEKENLTARVAFSSGTNVIVEWWLSDGRHACFEQLPPKTLAHTFNFHFTSPGSQRLVIVVSNGVSTEIKNLDFEVLPKKMKVTLETNNTIIRENERVWFISKEKTFTNDTVIMNITFGDKSYRLIRQFPLNKTIVIDHIYKSAGDFKLTYFVKYRSTFIDSVMDFVHISVHKRVDKTTEMKLEMTSEITLAHHTGSTELGNSVKTTNENGKSKLISQYTAQSTVSTTHINSVKMTNVNGNTLTSSVQKSGIPTSTLPSVLYDHYISDNYTLSAKPSSNVIYCPPGRFIIEIVVIPTRIEIALPNITCFVGKEFGSHVVLLSDKNRKSSLVGHVPVAKYRDGNMLTKLLCENRQSRLQFHFTLKLHDNPCFDVMTYMNYAYTNKHISAYTGSDIIIASRVRVKCKCRTVYLWKALKLASNATWNVHEQNLVSGHINLCTFVDGACTVSGIYKISVFVSLQHCNVSHVETWASEKWTVEVFSPTPMAFISGGRYRIIDGTNKDNKITFEGIARFHPGNNLTFSWKWTSQSRGEKIFIFTSVNNTQTLDLTNFLHNLPFKESEADLTLTIASETVNSTYHQKLVIDHVRKFPEYYRNFKCASNCLDKVAMSKKLELICTDCSQFNAIVNTSMNRIEISGNTIKINILDFRKKTLNVIMLDTVINFAFLVMYVNDRPYNGTCHASTNKGVEVYDRFFVICENWLDEGQELPLQNRSLIGSEYPLYYRVLLTEAGARQNLVILYEGWDNLSDMFRLPRGKKENGYEHPLLVEIVDLYGDAELVPLHITVYPANITMDFFTTVNDLLEISSVTDNTVQASLMSVVNIMKEAESLLLIFNRSVSETINNINEFIETSKNVEKVNTKVSEMLLEEVTNASNFGYQRFLKTQSVMKSSSSLINTSNEQTIVNIFKSLMILTSKAESMFKIDARWDNEDKKNAKAAICNESLDVMDNLLQSYTPEALFSQQSHLDNLHALSYNQQTDKNIKEKVKLLENQQIIRQSMRQRALQRSIPMILKTISDFSNFISMDIDSYKQVHHVLSDNLAMSVQRIHDVRHLETQINDTRMSFMGCHNQNGNQNNTIQLSKLRIGSLPIGNDLSVLNTDITIASLDTQSRCSIRSRHPIPHHAQPTVHTFHPVDAGRPNSYKITVPTHIGPNDAFIVYLDMDKRAEIGHVYVAYIGRDEQTNADNYLLKKTLKISDKTSFGYRLFIQQRWLLLANVYIVVKEEKKEEKNNNGRRKRSYYLNNVRNNWRALTLSLSFVTSLKKITTQSKTNSFPTTSTLRTPSTTYNNINRQVTAITTPPTPSKNTFRKAENFTIKMTAVFTGCRSFDESRKIWNVNNCKVLGDSTVNFTICKCPHFQKSILTTTFFVAPNIIPFTSPFLHFDPENAAIYGTIICLLGVYVVVVIILRREDKKDQFKWTTYFLCDSDSADSYLYLISVYTGFRRGAGTKSNVMFILSGEDEDTGVRILSDGVRQGFETGSVRRFFMGTPYPLGDLSYLRIWHNNDGNFGQQSWYLKKLVIDDLSGKQSYTFTCERWLSSYFGDGKIDRIIPACRFDINSSFNSKFTEHAQYSITEDHIWLSLLLRPQRSNFTRVQRATCALCLLLLTMIANAMFYGQPHDNVHADLVQMGSIRLSISDIYMSTVGVAVTTPAILLLSFLFRKTRRKQSTGTNETCSASPRYDSVKKRATCAIPCDQFYTFQKLPLPHWVVYLAWAILVGTIAFSIYVMIAYSMEWGKSRSEKWLVSFTLSFVQSVLVVDPVKVFLLAVLFAAVLKTKKECKIQADIDQIQRVSSTFDNLSESRVLASMRMEMLHKDEPPTKEVLQHSRLRRMQEIHAQKVFAELVLFGVYAFVIYAMSYLGRDQRAFTLKNHLENTFITKSSPGFNMVNTSADYVEWLSRVFIPKFYPYDDCRGHKREYAYIADCANIRVGPPRLRQVRVRSEDCTSYIVPVFKPCYPRYDTKNEDRTSYCPGWIDDIHVNCSLQTGKYFTNLSVWSHTDADELQTVGTNGEYNAYSGGGYVLMFPSTQLYAEEMAAQMPSSNWLDRGTRAVFLEFTLYNPNVNLFTYALIVTEFPETGSVFRWVNIHVFRPYDFVGSTGTLSIFCYFIFLVILAISTFKNFRDIKNARCAFFKQAWNAIDLMCNILSYATIALYVLRTLSAKNVMDHFLERLARNEFTYFQKVVILNFTVENCLAVLVFVATIRILKILGYNKRLTEITSVITNALWDLAGFGVVFTVVFMAYVLYGFLLFGRSLDGYKSVFSSFGTLTNTLIGKNKLDTSVRSVPGTAQLYYFTYNFVVLWTVMTMFAAILNKSIEEVRNQIKCQPRVYGIFDMFKTSLRSLFGGTFMRSKEIPKFKRGLTKQQQNVDLKFNAKNVLELVRDILKKHTLNMTEPVDAKPCHKDEQKRSSHTSPVISSDKDHQKYQIDDGSDISCVNGKRSSLRRRRMSVSRAGTLKDIDLVIKDINMFT